MIYMGQPRISPAPRLGAKMSLNSRPILDNEELFVSYAEFPWFKQATVEQITTIERPSSNHLYWPLLDVDVSVESIRDPAAFPLISKINPSFEKSR